MKKLFALALTTSVLTFSPLLHAESTTDNSTTSIKEKHEKWKNLTPEQKAQKKAERKAKWEAMSPQEREAFKAEKKAKWQERYNNATPEQQVKMKARMEKMKARHAERKANKAEAIPETTAPAAGE